MTTVAVIDIDTTIADNEHRAHLVANREQPAWDQFLDPSVMILDSPVKHCRDVIDNMRKHGYLIVFLTGRGESLTEVTSAWLQIHMGWDPLTEPLIMRPVTHDSVPASEFKEEALLSFIRDRQLERATFLFFEDDKYVLRVWKKYGLVFQCPEAWETMNPETLEENEPAWKR